MIKRREPIAGRKTSRSTNVPEHLRGVWGRPRKLTDEQRQQVLEAYRTYVKNTDDPTVADFVSSVELCWELNVLDHNIEDWQEFSGLTKRAIMKQQAFLLRQGGAGNYNPALAIFRLKQPQHGFKDRFDTDITSKGEQIGAPITADQASQLLKLRAGRANVD